MLNQALGRLLFTGALAALSFSARGARADQFVVAEATYTHSAQTTTDSHYRVKPTADTPVNWQSPVDYTQGSVHVRLEVKTKPSATPTRYQICFEMKMNYCCTDQAPPYTTIGVYEWDTDVEKLWRPGPVDFTKGIVQSALILKDTNNVKPSPENVGAATSALYMPSDLSVTVTVVSNDAVYQAPAWRRRRGRIGGSCRRRRQPGRQCQRRRRWRGWQRRVDRRHHSGAVGRHGRRAGSRAERWCHHGHGRQWLERRRRGGLSRLPARRCSNAWPRAVGMAGRGRMAADPSAFRAFALTRLAQGLRRAETPPPW
jgi:hypothetical protein